MIIVTAFGMIGGSVLAASSRAPAFILRMILFALALSAATTVSHGWGIGMFFVGFLVASTSAQVGCIAMIAIRVMLAQRTAAPALDRDIARLL